MVAKNFVEKKGLFKKPPEAILLAWISFMVTIASQKDPFPIGFFLFHPGVVRVVSPQKIAYGDFLKRPKRGYWIQ